MKQQTYISKIETADGKMLDFERWSFKQLATVEKKAVEFFHTMMKYGFFREQVKDASKITIYDNNNTAVKTIPLKTKD